MDDADDGLLDQLLVGVSDLGGTGLSLVAGRQDLQVGDGFLIGDGYRDSKAALWNIPLNFYDAVRADWHAGPVARAGLRARGSRPRIGDDGGVSQGQPVRRRAGLERGRGRARSPSVYFQREDDGDTELDARAFSLRGALGARGFTLAGELVAEVGHGRRGGPEGRRRAPRASRYAFERKGEPYAQLEYFLFSGDDPGDSRVRGVLPLGVPLDRLVEVVRGGSHGLDAGLQQRRAHLEARVRLTRRSRTPACACCCTASTSTPARATAASRGVGRGFADEADLVVDQGLGEHWSAWVMGGYARPRAAAKALVGGAASGQFFLSLTYKFEGPGGGSGD